MKPILKKPNADITDLLNFRPISNLSFISKILEKTVLLQIQSFLDENSIREFQSGFRTNHSTESALLRVLNYILLSLDSGDSVILILLDLRAAFDTVDHRILLSRLERSVGIRGNALSWFKSYLTNRTFSVGIGDSVLSSYLWRTTRLHSGSYFVFIVYAAVGINF